MLERGLDTPRSAGGEIHPSVQLRKIDKVTGQAEMSGGKTVAQISLNLDLDRKYSTG